jgi:hypothetical protein
MLRTKPKSRGERKRRREWRAAKSKLAIGYAEEQPVPPVVVYPDEREVCSDTPEGRNEYWERTKQMANRQGWICACGCGDRLDFTESPFREGNLTFDHEDGRTKSRRDDRLEVVDPQTGKKRWKNAAMKYICNQLKGSRRIPYAEHARNA